MNRTQSPEEIDAILQSTEMEGGLDSDPEISAFRS